MMSRKLLRLSQAESLAVAATTAIRGGDLEALTRLLNENQGLATARIVDPSGVERTLLHVVADWPGHFPNSGRTAAVIIAAGADVNAGIITPDNKPPESPLHWAASSDDIDLLDSLLDAGADIEKRGGVIGGGTAMADAVAFAQWRAARRLVERGAQTTLWEAAALGLLDRVKASFTESTRPDADTISLAFWLAAHGGQRETADFLLEHGADINWLPRWERRTAVDAAERNGFQTIADWLRSLGGKPATSIPRAKG